MNLFWKCLLWESNFQKAISKKENSFERVISKLLFFEEAVFKKYFLRKPFWGSNSQNAFLEGDIFKILFFKRAILKIHFGGSNMEYILFVGTIFENIFWGEKFWWILKLTDEW